MTKGEYKKIIDDFLINNWDYLLECAKNILRTKRKLSKTIKHISIRKRYQYISCSERILFIRNQ